MSLPNRRYTIKYLPDGDRFHIDNLDWIIDDIKKSGVKCFIWDNCEGKEIKV